MITVNGDFIGAYNHSCRKVGTESMKRAVQALRNTVIMASGTTVTRSYGKMNWKV